MSDVEVRRLAIQNGVCVCVCAASAIAVLTAASPAALGHNEHDALTQYVASFAYFAEGDSSVMDFHCANSYLYQFSALVPPAGCPGACADVNGIPGQISCSSPVTAASIVTGADVKFNLDCWVHVVNPPQGGTVNSRVTTAAGETSRAECQFSWDPSMATGLVEYADHRHWSRTHGIQPGPLPIMVTDDFTLHQEFLNSGRYVDLRVFHNWYLMPTSPVVAAYISDGEDDTIYFSNDASNHDWNLTDPGGDDRLYQGGLDVTPPLGGTRTLEPGVTLTRADAGSGDVVWRLHSSISTKHLVLSQDRDGLEGRLWDIYAVVV